MFPSWVSLLLAACRGFCPDVGHHKAAASHQYGDGGRCPDKVRITQHTKLHDTLLETVADPQWEPLGFSALLLHVEFHRKGVEIHDPLIHALLHILGGPDEAHEVDGLRPAPHAEGEAVFSGLGDQFAWHLVLGHLLAQRRQRMVLHAHQRRMVENGGGNSWRAQVRQRINVEIHRQIHLAVRALDVGRQELGLEMHQLLVLFDFSGRHIQAVQVGHVAMAVDVARLPDVLASGIDEGDIHPELRLRTQ